MKISKINLISQLMKREDAIILNFDGNFGLIVVMISNLNSNRSERGVKIFVNVMKSMRKARRIDIQCEG